MNSRTHKIDSLRQSSPAVLIIGGGINGIGTFRELSLQGVDVLLVDQGDFCSGASAASSRMAHGGIRYLENGEFRLVREAVQERNRLIKYAPRLVRPLPTTIPIFKLFSGLLNAPLKFLGLLEKPSERGGLIIKLGLLFYDAYTGRQRSVPRHRLVTRRTALKQFPSLNPNIKFSATYFDGLLLSPERLALRLLLDAEAQASHASAMNYIRLVGRSGDSFVLQDEITNRQFMIRPQVVINAAGPWIDAVNHSIGLQTEYIGPTKGSHLVLDNPELRRAIGDHEFFFENRDGRIVLILPLFDKVMIGTSDLPLQDPDSARCSDQEVAYFLEMIARVFPAIRVTPEQIVFRFSGVRPLAKSSSARAAGQITRDHHIREDVLAGTSVLSLVGGKWTSFRAFSEQVADRTLALLGMPRIMDTRSLPMDKPEDENRLRTDGQYTPDEIRTILAEEMVCHLDDLVLRRTLLAYLGLVDRPLLDQLASQCGEILGWDALTCNQEVSRTISILADRHGIAF